MLKSLSRKTNSLTFIPEIDGLRFFAIITVVIYHLNSVLSDSLGFDWKSHYGMEGPMDFGWWIVRLDLGVKVFFAISGFILSMPFLKQYLAGGRKVEFRSYFVRRLLRLEPPFIASLVLFFISQIILLEVDVIDYSKHLLANLLYSHGIIYGYPSPINPVTWSLETEAQFYVCIPFFLSFVFLGRKKWVSLVILCISFIIGLYLRRYIFGYELNHLTASMLVYLTNFISGILFGWFFIIKPHFFVIKSELFDILGLIAIFGLFWFYKPQSAIHNNLIFNTSIFLFFISVFKSKYLNWFFTRRLIFSVGGMCYTIYLIHFGVLYFLAQKLSFYFVGMEYHTQFILFTLISLMILTVITVLFFIFIEKPCMDKDWPKKLSNYFLKK